MKKRLMCIIIAFAVMLNVTAWFSSVSTVKANSKAANPVTISLVMKDEGPSNATSVAYFKQLEKNLKQDEKIDVKIELVEMPQGNYAEKLNLMLLGGNIPDIMYFQGGDEQISQQGLLENLTPYIKNSKYIKGIMTAYSAERMKNYPYLLWIKPLAQKVPVIRKDWYDNIKVETTYALMKNPTIDNYYNFLKEIKKSPPGGKGKPAYSITVAGSIVELDNIFDMAFGNTATWIKGKNGKYVYAKVTNNEKQKLAFYNKLYKAGILDPQFATKKWDTKEKAFYDGDVAVISGTAGKVIDIYEGKIRKINGRSTGLMVLPPAKGKSQGFGATDVTKESRGIAINSQSKNKDIAFKILDYIASPRGQMLDRLGFENVHYKVASGRIELTDKSQEWYARFWEPNVFKPTIPLKSSLLGIPGAKSLAMTEKYYIKDKNFLMPDKYVAKWDAMQNLYKEFSVDVITGKKPISNFDKFVQDWNKAGGEEITQYANKNMK